MKIIKYWLYNIIKKTIEAGIILYGWEVKGLRKVRLLWCTRNPDDAKLFESTVSNNSYSSYYYN